MQQPTVGRVVHYQAYGTPGGEYKSVPRAAIITGAALRPGEYQATGPAEDDYKVSLCVLNPAGMFFNLDVPYSDPPKAGCWNWPPKV